ncbi:ATP-binding protein [Rhizohabitans arisaemae]|uniref:ATP-binding protein n=1 Tax=Rhizohabitans arisaemae TaxID=2720610 RepID=UPI0024B11A7C|nr:ATP-binding protein [Rhizohabitans arisaemae]
MVPVARAFARQFLLDHPFVADTELVLSELVTNAVVHGSGVDVAISLVHKGDSIRVEVSDHGSDSSPIRRDPSPDADGGRGLLLVDSIASRWGHEGVPGLYTMTWAEISTEETHE